MKDPLIRLHQNSLLNGEFQLYCIAVRDNGWHLSIFVSNASAEQVNAVTSSSEGKVNLQSIPNWQTLTFDNVHIVEENGPKRNHHYYNDNGTILWAQKPNEASLGAQSWHTANRLAAQFFGRLGVQVDVNALDIRAGIAQPPKPVVPVSTVPVNQLPSHMRPRVVRTNAKASTPTPRQQVQPPMQQPPQFPPQVAPQQAVPQQQFVPMGGFGQYPYDPSQFVYDVNEIGSNFMETGDW